MGCFLIKKKQKNSNFIFSIATLCLYLKTSTKKTAGFNRTEGDKMVHRTSATVPNESLRIVEIIMAKILCRVQGLG